MNDIEISSFIKKELNRQQEHIELIASENFVSKDILEACGSILTNKYAEGYPNKDIMEVVSLLMKEICQ